MTRYSTEPCFKDCIGDGLHNAHYHQIDGDDIIRKISKSIIWTRILDDGKYEVHLVGDKMEVVTAQEFSEKYVEG